MKLFAFVKRKDGMSREEFFTYWHTQHGPLIRDTPGLGDRTVSYVQHPARPDDRSGWDGVAVQEFASWDDFLAMLDGEAGEKMRADEANFLDPSSIKVVFTDDEVVIIGDGAGMGESVSDGDGAWGEGGAGSLGGVVGAGHVPGEAVGDVANEGDFEALTGPDRSA